MTLQKAYRMTCKITHKIIYKITRRITYIQMNLFKVNGITLLATVNYPPDSETQSQVYQYTLLIICSQALQLHGRKS